MADVENAPETTIVSKTVESKVEGSANKTEETKPVNVIETGEVNGVNENTANSTEGKAVNVEKMETTDVKQECQQEKSVVTKEELDTADQTAKVKITGETEGNPEVVVAEKKEETPSKVILHQFPPGKYIPNASPFCLKLETFLRIHKIPYENQYGTKMGKKGKLPWIEYKGEVKADSNFIISYLNDKFEVDLDKNFTSEQLALGRVTRVMLEENTYWALVYNRYIDNFDEFKKCIAPSGIGLGFSISQKLFQGKMRTNLDGHGLGRHTKEELYSIAEQDLKAVSDLLGNKPYLLGDGVSSFDCAVFGLCANVLYSGVESPMSAYIKEHATNLNAFCKRMKETYWKDWSDIVSGEKVEPALGESKSPAQNEPEKEGKDTPAEDASADEKVVENAAAESQAEKKPEPANEDKTGVETDTKAETPLETKPDQKE